LGATDLWAVLPAQAYGFERPSLRPRQYRRIAAEVNNSNARCPGLVQRPHPLGEGRTGCADTSGVLWEWSAVCHRTRHAVAATHEPRPTWDVFSGESPRQPGSRDRRPCYEQRSFDAAEERRVRWRETRLFESGALQHDLS
jgi:hypothetical protein